MRCPSCGKEVREGANFCSSCGTQLAAPSERLVCDALTSADASKQDASDTAPEADKAETNPLEAVGQKAERMAGDLAGLTAKLTAKATSTLEGMAEEAKADKERKAAGDPGLGEADGASSGPKAGPTSGAKPASKKMPKPALIASAVVLVAVLAVGASSLFRGSGDSSPTLWAPL